jgi:hypothetical protein
MKVHIKGNTHTYVMLASKRTLQNIVWVDRDLLYSVYFWLKWMTAEDSILRYLM